MAKAKSSKESAPTAGRTRKPRAAKAAVATDDLLAVLVLDESSSMAVTIGTENVVESVDEYMVGLCEDEANSDGQTLVSLTAFNSGATPFRHWHVAEPVESIPSIGNRYHPSGSTALHDAIAYSLGEADLKLRELGQENMKVLHVTITDGGENASHDYPREGNGGNRALAALTREYEFLTPQERVTLSPAEKDEIVAQRVADDEPQGTWTFVWLNGGVNNQEAAMVAGAGIGYRPENSIMFAASAAGASNSMSSLRTATHMRKTSDTGTSSSFFADAGQSLADYADPNAAQPLPVVPVVGDVANAAGVKIEKSSINDLLGGK